MDLLQLCQLFHLYEDSVADKYTEKKNEWCTKKRKLEEVEQEKIWKISKTSLAYKNLWHWSAVFGKQIYLSYFL